MGATDYTEYEGSPIEDVNISSGEHTATRIFQCDWADRYLVRARLLAYSTGKYEYDTRLYPVSASITPFASYIRPDTGYKSLWDKALITVKYAAINGYSADPNEGSANVTHCEYCSQTINTEIEFLSVTSGDLFWDNGQTQPVDDGQAPTKLIPFRNLSITFHNASQIHADFNDLIGTINTAAYSDVLVKKSLTTNTRTGNYLYKGYTANRSLTTAGSEGWDITINLSEIMNGESTDAWNKFFNPTTQAWSHIYDVNGSIRYMYDDESWTNLGLPTVQ